MRPLYVLACLATLAFAQSQPPSPTPRKDSHPEQKQTSTQNSQTTQHNQQAQPAPLTINQYNTDPNSREVHGDAAEKGKDASFEWINTVSTALLAAFTMVLAIATGALCVVAYFQWQTMKGHATALDAMRQHMSDGLEETRKTANAARDSADAAQASTEVLTSIERPWIRIKQIWPPRLMAERDLRFEFDIENRGRTPAKISGVWARLAVFDTDKEPPPPDYTATGEQPGEDSAADGWLLFVGEARHHVTPEVFIREPEVKAIQERRLMWCFYGLVKYFDAAARPHESQFCYIYYIPDGTEAIVLDEGWRVGGSKTYNRYS